MNMFEEAERIRIMTECDGITQKDVAKLLGISQSYLSNKLRLLNFSKSVQKQIIDSGISERHARALLRITSEDEQLSAIRRISSEKMTVERTEAMIATYTDPRLPERIGNGERIKKTDAFLDVIKEAASSLSAMGIGVAKTIKHQNGKLYISITIDETF